MTSPQKSLGVRACVQQMFYCERVDRKCLGVSGSAVLMFQTAGCSADVCFHGNLFETSCLL